MAQLQKAGYIPVAAFCLPEYCWTKIFYEPQVEAQKVFMEKYPDSLMAKELMANLSHEEEMYHKYKEYYGYVFYTGREI